MSALEGRPPEGLLDSITPVGQVDFVTPRELSLAEIAGVIDDYTQATRRAIEAGFDGVELHGAPGYLPEQFLSSGSYQRQDRDERGHATMARSAVDGHVPITASPARSH